MKPNTNLWPFAIHPLSAALLGFALAGCAAPEPPPAPSPSAAVRPTPVSVSFASGAASSARVTRTPAPDGGETLHGETEIALGAGQRRCIVEDASLDVRGRLIWVEIAAAASCDASPDTQATLDPVSGIARFSVGAVTTELHVQGDAWVYTPEALPGHAATTPVAAWVARRAAQSAPVLTLIQLDQRQAWRVPRDQVAVPTELGTTVVLGDGGAEVGAGFVDRVRLADYGVTLVRIPEGAPAI